MFETLKFPKFLKNISKINLKKLQKSKICLEKKKLSLKSISEIF